MKVITLIDNDFDIAAHRLSDMVMADFSPDLAVGCSAVVLSWLRL